MKVSVIVPLYYGEKYVKNILSMLKKNVESLHENSVGVEVIFINDSPDEEIQLNTSDEVKLYYNECNLGIHASRVRGLRYAVGEYVLFLDQDDKITDNYISSQLLHIGYADAVVCNGYHKEGKMIYDMGKMPQIHRETIFCSKNMILSPGQVLLKRESIPKEWQQKIMKYSGTDDFWLWILMIVDQKVFTMNGDVLYTHVENGKNSSYNWKSMMASVQEMIAYVMQQKKISNVEKEQLKNVVNRSIYKWNRYACLEEKWKKLDEEGKSIDEFFKSKDVQEIAVYGYGVIGKKLVKELQNNNIKIKYIIDQDKTCQNSQMLVFTPNDIFPSVDILIVTPLFDYEKIKSSMQRDEFGRIISIEEVIEEVLEK